MYEDKSSQGVDNGAAFSTGVLVDKGLYTEQSGMLHIGVKFTLQFLG